MSSLMSYVVASQQASESCVRKYGPWWTLLALLLCSRSLAQNTTGLIFGTVFDVSRAVIPNATVVVVEQLTGLTRTVRTDKSGEYSASLSPGQYQVRVAANSFRNTVVDRVAVSVSDKVHVDVTLSLGSQQVIEVSGVTAPTNTESSELSRVISEKEIAGLPLNNRNLSQAFLLTNGAVQSKPGTANSFIYNGTSQYGYNLSLDGTDASQIEAATPADQAGTGRLNTVSLDAIREFQIETGSFSAVNGRATGAIINIISKSGSDQLHGTAFEYFRNNYLDALNRFATSATPLRQNQFGGSLGGPIVNNRYFFFGSYEASRAKIGQIITSNVPTAAFRRTAPSVFTAYFAALPLPQTTVSSTTGLYRRQDNAIYTKTSTTEGLTGSTARATCSRVTR